MGVPAARVPVLLSFAIAAQATFKDRDALHLAALPLAGGQPRDAAATWSEWEGSAGTPLTSESFQSISGDIARLKQQMDTLRDEKANEVNLQRNKFQEVLMEQDRENSALYAQSLETRGNIEARQHHLQKLRKMASEIDSSCLALRDELSDTRENISDAREFIQNLLDQPDGSSSPEVKILAEVSLSGKKAARNVEDDRVNRTVHSLFQFNAKVTPDRPDLTVPPVASLDPETALEVVRSLKRSVRDLSSYHNQSLAELRAVFNQSYERGREAREDLLAKQRALNATQDALVSLEHRLNAAVALEANSRGYLQSRLNSLRSFLAMLGRSPLAVKEEAASEAFLKEEAEEEERDSANRAVDTPHLAGPTLTPAAREDAAESDAEEYGAAMLQTGAGVAAALAPAHESRSLPFGADLLLPGASSKVDMELVKIEQGLVSMDRAHHESKDAQMLAYSKELLNVNTDTLQQARANAQVASTVEKLKSQQHHLLRHGRELQSRIALLRDDLDALRLNLSTAMDFAAETLRKANISDAPDLGVLRMLSNGEALHNTEKLHQDRLAEVNSIFEDLPMPIKTAAEEGDVHLRGHVELSERPGELQAAGLLQTGAVRTTPARAQLDELFALRRQREIGKEQQREIGTDEEVAGSADAAVVHSLDSMEERIREVVADRHRAAERFEEELKMRLDTSSSRQGLLAKEGEALESSRRSMEELRDRLQLAIQHLDQVHKGLLAGSAQVRDFLRRIGPGQFDSTHSPSWGVRRAGIAQFDSVHSPVWGVRRAGPAQLDSIRSPVPGGRRGGSAQPDATHSAGWAVRRAL